MPAVTVDDISALPHIPQPDPAASSFRPVISVNTAPRGLRGRRIPRASRIRRHGPRAIDPFIHMDQMGEVEYAPGEPKGTPWHPHRGFETVTYMIDGTFQHQDSNGGGGLITNGDTQWMTAGAGILHIERPPEELDRERRSVPWLPAVGQPSWLHRSGLPARYQDIRAGNVALLTSYDGGALLRVIAGEVAGHRGPGVTYTPISLAHVT